jgi:hypothetical protein
MGLEQIAVGREWEMAALSRDFELIREGGASFRFAIGRYGSGKSFLLQLLRNAAMERGFVVADADLSPQLRLSGTQNQAVATYRELMKNLATRTHPHGGAIALILEKWISSILNQVARTTEKRPGDAEFDAQVEHQIRAVADNLEGLVHGFDFANVIIAYWRGYREDNRDLKEAALRWLRGEFATKTEAKTALGTRVIIDDESWYDYIKLFAQFSANLGYGGLIIFLDEAVHLYKITNARSRQSNYDQLLAMFNDALQGKAEYLGIYVGGTPQFLEDKRRGLHSDEAWRTRLTQSRFLQPGQRDSASPILQLEPLTHADIAHLLQQLGAIHAAHYQTDTLLRADQIEAFVQMRMNRLGAEKLTSPREIVRDAIACLNILQQNRDLTFEQLIASPEFQPTHSDLEEDGYTVSI